MQQTSAGVDAPRVHIITDSASDLVQGELEGISAVVPLSIAFGDEEYLDGVDLSHHRFYEKLVESDELPRTSQVILKYNIFEWNLLITTCYQRCCC